LSHDMSRPHLTQFGFAISSSLSGPQPYWELLISLACDYFGQ
jgi:hypothetical protein